MSVPCPSAVVIGPGRVGRAISSFYKPPALLINRKQQLPAGLADTPIWVCTTNDGLDSVLQHTAVTQVQRQQLVFVQNGMLLPWLKQHGLERNTQVLLYMSATEDGKVTDGLRTAVCGPHAQHVSDTLTANCVHCAVVQDWGQFQQLMLVKLLWSSIFWLLSAGLGGTPVGQVAQQHEADVSRLVAELLPLGQDYLRTSSSSNQQQQQLGHTEVMEQLLSYSLAIAAAVPSVEMARCEFGWRNGFFLGQPGGRTRHHCDWLARAGCSDLL